MRTASLDIIAAANNKPTTDELRHPVGTLRDKSPVPLTRQQARDFLKMQKRQEALEKKGTT